MSYSVNLLIKLTASNFGVPTLPNSLRELGDNPIQLLYKKTSEGLHSLKEDICLERAQSIVTILEFTIKKINEEHSDIKEVKEAVKKLK